MFVLQQSSTTRNWVNVDEFDSQASAEVSSQALADYAGKTCRVVELVVRSTQKPKKGAKR